MSGAVNTDHCTEQRFPVRVELSRRRRHRRPRCHRRCCRWYLHDFIALLCALFERFFPRFILVSQAARWANFLFTSQRHISSDHKNLPSSSASDWIRNNGTTTG